MEATFDFTDCTRESQLVLVQEKSDLVNLLSIQFFWCSIVWTRKNFDNCLLKEIKKLFLLLFKEKSERI